MRCYAIAFSRRRTLSATAFAGRIPGAISSGAQLGSLMDRFWG